MLATLLLEHDWQFINVSFQFNSYWVSISTLLNIANKMPLSYPIDFIEMSSSMSLDHGWDVKTFVVFLYLFWEKRTFIGGDFWQNPYISIRYAEKRGVNFSVTPRISALPPLMCYKGAWRWSWVRSRRYICQSQSRTGNISKRLWKQGKPGPKKAILEN